MRTRMKSALMPAPEPASTSEAGLRLTLTTIEAARAIGVSRAHLARLIARNAIRSLKIGKRRLFRVEDVQAFLAERVAETRGDDREGGAA